MIDPELLKILACPATHQPLTEADEAALAALNERVKTGGCTNVAGQEVTEPLDGALVREDGTLAYPVRDTIPVLLVDEGIPLT